MIKLKGVSKYYHQNGIISSGMIRIDLELDRGEFVAITGESGSGKSTLLNVISGLDSYEEGEMYICGEETSAYTEEDYEKYRKKYISNIFQNFNLINSYTVYQNVALAMQLSGEKAGRAQRQKIYDVLKKVGLYRYRHAMASRLSGGQKQRVAIARALVRNTPVIVADEPTGNLDSKAAAAVIKLLRKIADDRLVIVVTHNYEQVEPYVTRKITMNDGRIIEDRQISSPPEHNDEEPGGYEKNLKSIRPLQLLRLGIRNSFNVVPKFLLLLFIFIFTTFAVSGFYATMRKNSYDSSLGGYNWYFQNTSDKRIVLKKADMTPFTDEELEAIRSMDNTESVIENDLLLDRYISASDDEGYYIYGRILPLSNLTDELSFGSLPENDTDFVIGMNGSYYLNDEAILEEMATKNFHFYSDSTGERVTSFDSHLAGSFINEGTDWYVTFYVSDRILDEVQSSVNFEFATVITRVNGNEFRSDPWNFQNKVMPNSRVPSGCMLVPEDWDYLFPENYDYEAVGKSASVNVKTLYYDDTRWFTIWDTYDKDSFQSKTGLMDFEWQGGVLMINPSDYASFFDKGNYQISLFISDPKKAEETVSALSEAGYVPLYIRDTVKRYDGTWTLIDNIMNVLWSAVLTAVLFFIDYSIIKLIMRSRNTYYSTVRMLGARKRDVRALLFLDLWNVLNIAFALSVGAIYSVWKGYIHLENAMLTDIMTYLKVTDYAAIYAVLFLISVIISQKYAKQLFKDTALSTLRQEA